MSTRNRNLAFVIDEVLADANATACQRAAESEAVKTATARPSTDLARNLQALANSIRTASDDLTYDDLSRTS